MLRQPVQYVRVPLRQRVPGRQDQPAGIPVLAAVQFSAAAQARQAALFQPVGGRAGAAVPVLPGGILAEARTRVDEHQAGDPVRDK